ncbi:hypothetical protein CFC21_037923 [Triticum aestivum]|uniref:F-box domain-containing protein n=2 Tax=Triticum aestivum TaxID=4565 RepID=A0A3B6ERR2_WHEAT|nr:hypothetical protein CFC21_037923 [Triticum aestivum]
MPSLRALPEEIAIWEILVRLPPKALLRCRIVCRAWRRITSTRDFLLAHHARQPALLLLDDCTNYAKGISDSLNIICFDHRAGVATPDQLQPVARLTAQTSFHLDAALMRVGCRGDNISYYHPVASCDGLLILCVEGSGFFICNPATRQYACLPLPLGHAWWLLGMYPHPSTDEYRLLLYSYKRITDDERQDACHVLALGSGHPPRHIGLPDAVTLGLDDPHVLFRGSLHWCTSDYDGECKTIGVFDTRSELFREMRTPIVASCVDLFEMDDMFGVAILDCEKIIDIRVLQDYEREIWALNRRIELPFVEIRVQCDKYDTYIRSPFYVSVTPGDGELLVLVKFADWLLVVGTDGKLVATLHRKGLDSTYFQLKQSLVSHTFFHTQENYVVNAPPFI